MLLDILSVLFDPGNFALILFGSFIGMVAGAIPGLSGGIAITVCLPLTFAMDQAAAICLLCGLWIGSASGSYIGSILLGIPGTTSSIATCYDGYEFTKQGDPVRALSVGTVSNFIGTVPSMLIALLLSPIIANWAVKLGPWEYFSLALCAILMVTGLSKGELVKGLIVAAFALMLVTVGQAPVSGTPRFVFNYHFSGGFGITSVMLGMFAGRLILLEYARGEKENQEKVKVTKFRWPGKDLKDNMKNKNIPVSFGLGLWIGFLPGLGGALSNLMAYSVAKNSSKYPEKFGKGCIDGVIAPEVANNASVGGAVIPFVALGIPGDTISALLLGALLIQGIEPGPLFYKTNPTMFYTIMAVLIVGAIFVFLLQVFGMPLLPMLLRVPYQYLYPALIMMIFMGSYAGSPSMFTLYTNLAFSAIGVFLVWAGMPISPFMLSFVLGKICESNLRKAVSYSLGSWWPFLTRPISCALIIVAIAACIWPYAKDWIAAAKAKKQIDTSNG